MGLSSYFKGSFKGRYRVPLKGFGVPVGLVLGRFRVRLSVGVFVGALLFGLYDRAPDFWKRPCELQSILWIVMVRPYSG